MFRLQRDRFGNRRFWSLLGVRGCRTDLLTTFPIRSAVQAAELVELMNRLDVDRLLVYLVRWSGDDYRRVWSGESPRGYNPPAEPPEGGA